MDNLESFIGGKSKMQKSISPISRTGLLMLVTISIIERFITPISDYIAIPVLVVGIVLIIVGGIKTKESDWIYDILT